MLISYIFLINFFSIIILFFLQSIRAIKLVALNSAGLIFIFSSALLLEFNTEQFYFQNVVIYDIGLEFLNLFLIIGLDGISIYFFFLSSFLIFLCLLFVWGDKSFKMYAINLLLINIFLLFVFSVLDLLFFYIFFEAILLPMFYVIGTWGSRERKIRAVYLFFFYTLVGSLCMLMGLIYIYTKIGTLNFEYLAAYSFTSAEQYFLWLAFFLSFAAKVPLFPLHVWLPEAHVEAPTVGSVLLAGILLKLGIYGFLRFSLVLFPLASVFFSPFIYLLGIFGIVYASFTAIRQTDLKRIIAYSSVAHMNLVVLGLFSFNLFGVEGSILQSISHGFVASALFLLIGILYDRYHSRFLYYYSGLIHMMPVYGSFFLFFTLSNIALPGSSSFIGEFLLLNGLFKNNVVCCLFATLGVILCGAYSLWLYNRIIFGNLKIFSTLIYKDISLREFTLLLPLFFWVLFLGIYPFFFTEYLHLASLTLTLLLSHF